MPVELYGLSEKGLEQARQADVELLLAFNRRLFTAKGWLGRYQHLRNAIDLLWNEPLRRNAIARGLDYDVRKHDAFIWNEWTEEMLEGYCEGHWGTVVTGPNASGKTTATAVYYLCKWYASPADTSIVLTSTSLPGLRKRIWKELLKYHR